jgi:hypothetical protein
MNAKGKDISELCGLINEINDLKFEVHHGGES